MTSEQSQDRQRRATFCRKGALALPKAARPSRFESKSRSAAVRSGSYMGLKTKRNRAMDTVLSKTFTATADQDPRWQAVMARDTNADGTFVFSVRTTGVYCRPS